MYMYIRVTIQYAILFNKKNILRNSDHFNMKAVIIVLERENLG